MPRIEEVLKAENYDPDLHTNFPYYATPKVDGIRFHIRDGQVLSRRNILHPNRHIQRILPLFLPNGVDGELLVGPYNAPDHFQRTQSVVRSFDAPIDDLNTYLIDFVHPNFPGIGTYKERILSLNRRFSYNQRMWCSGQKLAFVEDYFNVHPSYHEWPIALKLHRQTSVLLPVSLLTPIAVENYLAQMLESGYEGIVLRKPLGTYKFGRSTQKEELLLRYKPLEDAEATILSVFEEMENTNESKPDETGRLRKSTEGDCKRPTGLAGGFTVKDLVSGEVFNLTARKGLSDEVRKDIYANHRDYVGRTVRYSYQRTGTKDKPRIAKFEGFRDD